MPRERVFVKIENWIDRPNNQEWKESGRKQAAYHQGFFLV